jgi:hypothetical protein
LKGGGWNMFWKNDKGLKRLGIIFQSGWFYPAKSRLGRSPSPEKLRFAQSNRVSPSSAKTKTWQGPSLSFCFFPHQGGSTVLHHRG